MNTTTNIQQRVSRTLQALHVDQSGAIAMAVMAALLITLMMALVLFDTTPAARQKLEVQTAADTAAWSQSAVEARSMNMIAFANVGKRILMGQAHFYVSLKKAHLVVLALAIAALAGCIALASFTGVCASHIAHFTNDVTNITNTLANEASDIASFHNEILGRVQEDMAAIDSYQTYFRDYTPWWSFGEAWRRGLRNGAYVASWPTPGLPDAVDGLPSFKGIGFSGVTDSLPIERDESIKEMCIRSRGVDLGLHVGDYVASTVVGCRDCVKKAVPSPTILTALMQVTLTTIGGLAAGIYRMTCSEGLFTEETSRPWQLIDPSSYSNNEAEWFRRTSNLVFAYQPGEKFVRPTKKSSSFLPSPRYQRSQKGLGDKYSFLSPDYTTKLDDVYKPDGFFGMARSEISFQNGNPDMWHPSWTVRMRPVALPGEWSAYEGNYRLVSAYIDTTPYLFVSATAGALAGDMLAGGLGRATPVDVGRDLIKGAVAFEAITNQVADGVAR